MRGILIVLFILMFAALLNAEALSVIVILLVVGYALTAISKTGKNTKSLMATLDELELKSPEGVLDNMMKDFGKVTKSMATAKPELNGKTIVKASVKALDNAAVVFKK